VLRICLAQRPQLIFQLFIDKKEGHNGTSKIAVAGLNDVVNCAIHKHGSDSLLDDYRTAFRVADKAKLGRFGLLMTFPLKILSWPNSLHDGNDKSAIRATFRVVFEVSTRMRPLPPQST
jgi:hypothetical protein